MRVDAAGVCHSDHHYLTGDIACPLPIVLGHEDAGVVQAVGPDVDRVAPGDTVAQMWRPRCGRWVYCLTGQPVGCQAARLSGRLPIDALLGQTYPLAAVIEAHAALTGGAVGRAVVVPGQ